MFCKFSKDTLLQQAQLHNSPMWHNMCQTFSYIQLHMQQRWDHEVLAIVSNYCRMTSAHYPIMASTQSPVGWLILCFHSGSSLSGCTYPLLSCSKRRSTGLRSGPDQSCRCPGHWGCVARRRANWGLTWPVDPRDEWSLVRADKKDGD